MKHQIQDYLSIDSLTPTDAQMGEIANSDWWTACKDHFDDLLWLYYPERTVFFNNRFPFNPSDPDNAANNQTVINNIKKSFAIFLKSKNYTYSKLYETTILEYNPLYNVDGTEITDRNLIQGGNNEHKLSGSDTTEYNGAEINTLSGKDTTEYSGSESNTLSGTDTTEYSGTESNTLSGADTTSYKGSEQNAKSGNDSDVSSGSDTSTTSNTTFDSAAWKDTQKVVDAPGTTETHNYNSTDTKSYTNREDEIEYGKTDTKSFDNREDSITYGKTDTKSFEDREDSITYGKTDTKSFNNREDSITYGKTDTETRNLHDDEHTEVRRFGNIGVTKSTDLIDSQRSTVLFDFFKTVCHDCINLVTYSVDAI